MKAVIMAGGEGTRLRPLTCGIPKPMVPILNKPVMEYTIKLLKKHDIKDIAVTMAYLPSVIMDYFSTGEEWGVNLNYFIEDTPLGTGGSVKNASKYLDDTFVVISGDALTDLDIQKAIDYHYAKKAKATLVLKKESIPLEYGVIITDESGRIVRFLEKPSWGEVFSDTINTGIYILEPEVLDYYRKGENFDFSKDLFPRLLKDNVPLYGFVTGDYWCDIGDIKSYMKTQFDMLDGKINVEMNCKETGESIWVHEGTSYGDDVNITPPVYIGKNCTLGGSVNIGPYTIIGDNCSIGESTTFKKSIVWKNTKIGKNTHCGGSIICNNVRIKDRVHLYEESITGEGSSLCSGVIVKPNIKIWPNKKIEQNTVINQNMVWGTRAAKTIFGYKDISGEINIDITPEFASQLGSAFASMMSEDATIVVSCDDSNASHIIKDSLVSGILSTGVGVIEISDAITPMNRFAVTQCQANGGIHVRMDCSEEDKVHIEFSDKNGANIDRNTERKIENIFNRGDFERSNIEKIKSAIQIDNFSSLYIKNGVQLLTNLPEIKRKNPYLIISSRSRNLMKLASTFLEYIGCKVQCDYSANEYNDVKEYLSYMAEQVRKNGAYMGVIMSENGENLIMIDEKGNIIDKDKYYALVSFIVLKSDISSKLVVPYTAPSIIEEMAKAYDVEVIRTKSSPSHTMKKMLSIKNLEDDFLIQYILNFDALWATGKIIDFLVENKTNLSELVNELPSFHLRKEEIECDWKDKGRVIRQIIIENRDEDIELFEGVKINSDKGWALVLPDSERPVFNVYAEGLSEEFADELSVFFSKKVKDILKNQRQ